MRPLKYLWNNLPGRLERARVLGAGLLALAVLAGWPAGAFAGRFPPDPVEDLRQALQQPGTAEGADLRQALLEKRAKALRSASDLARALLLREWQDESDIERVRVADRTVREAIARQFDAAVKEIFDHGDTASKIAVAQMIGEMAVATRTLGIKTTFLRGQLINLLPGLIALTQAPDPRLREAAAQALGKIQPEDSKPLFAALGRMLTKDDVPRRRAAAEALVNQARLVTQTEKKSQPDLKAVDYRTQILNVGSLVVPAAGSGLADPDALVRRLSAEAVQLIAIALADQIGEPPPDFFLPEGRPLTETERQRVDDFRRLMLKEREEIRPLLIALKDHCRRWSRT
jgi:hypothetical protein